MKNSLIALSAVTMLMSAPAFAQDATEDMDHGDHSEHMAAAEDAPASTKAYIEANNEMHEGMDIEFTGDADVDFVRGMIPHHQGAIDMAEVVLEHGENPEIRALAEDIIEAQEAEIAMMEAWLEENAGE